MRIFLSALTIASLALFSARGFASGSADPALDEASALLGHGRVLEAATLLRRVLGSLDDPELKKRAITVADAGLRAATDIEVEARFQILKAAIMSSHLSVEQRRYVRSAALVSTCARYDKANGNGSCALLALRLTGEPMNLRDASGTFTGRTLTDLEIERANADYLPLLKACLVDASQDASPELFESGTVTIEWSIDPSGRAADTEITPRRFRGLVGACMEERLSWIRYPRSSSKERKSVSISYELSTVERRQLVSLP
jgi:hypothetical protein